jgi:hypothetical protein
MIKQLQSQAGFEHFLQRERSKRLAAIEKKKREKGPYSTDQLIRQALDSKVKQIIQHFRIRGQEITETKARQMAAEIGDYHYKRFQKGN